MTNYKYHNEYVKYYRTDNHIHTTVEPHIKQKLIEYGNGCLNRGIENLIKISESKRIKVQVLTEVDFNE